MKILISQPKQESNLNQLRYELEQCSDVDCLIFPEGYIKNHNFLSEVQCLAKEHQTMIITGYLDHEKKDRALIISATGEIILDRAKTPVAAEKLIEPVIVSHHDQNFGYILCMEILKGLNGFTGDNTSIYFIAHPIGTGMFSEDQFKEWTRYATDISIKYNCFMIGTSHADGSFQNCGISIPIAYCIDHTGKPLFISKSDTRTRIVDLSKKEVYIP